METGVGVATWSDVKISRYPRYDANRSQRTDHANLNIAISSIVSSCYVGDIISCLP